MTVIPLDTQQTRPCSLISIQYKNKAWTDMLCNCQPVGQCAGKWRQTARYVFGCTYITINHALSLWSFSISREADARGGLTQGTAARAGWTSTSLKMSHSINSPTGEQPKVRRSGKGKPINGYVFNPLFINAAFTTALLLK